VKIADVSVPQLQRLLVADGVALRVGPFVTCLHSPIAGVAEGLHLVGAHHPLAKREEFVDFDIEIRPRLGLRPPFRRLAQLFVDGIAPFNPFPIGQSYAMFEWGLNWCIATRSDRFLLVHSAVVEKGGKALLLPAPPGSGKSTLCAALVCRGWRLLSDELAILRPDGLLAPIPRPVSLTNTSIDVIRHFEPSAVIGGTAHETIKGTVSYLRPPADSVDRQSEPAKPAFVVFPKYEAGSPLRFAPHSKARTLVFLAHNSFNYHVHGASGFELLADVLEHCECYDLRYGSLDDALRCVEALASAGAREHGTT